MATNRPADALADARHTPHLQRASQQIAKKTLARSLPQTGGCAPAEELVAGAIGNVDGLRDVYSTSFNPSVASAKFDAPEHM